MLTNPACEVDRCKRCGKFHDPDPQYCLKPAYTGGRKDDQEKKSRPGLIAPEMIWGMGCVLAFGARKYAPGNWAKGMDWSRPWDGLHRHLIAWAGGEKCDPETGYSHLLHAACCLMFLIAYEARGIGRDDLEEAGIRPSDKDSQGLD